MSVDPRYFAITDLLLGAVYADDRLEGEEEDAVRSLLSDLLGEDLPVELEARIANFEPESFDLRATAARFAEEGAIKQRKLLEVVAAVFDANGEVDFEEDEYLRELAEALGMDESDYGDLTIRYEMEDLDEALDIIVSVPPPSPPKK